MVIFLAASPASGQVDTGIPPFSSLAPSNLDTVNNANLNIMLAIPVVRRATKGMPFSYALGYNSSVWTPHNSSGQQAWTPAGNWGWAGMTAANPSFITNSWQQGYCMDPFGQDFWWDIWTYYNYYDPSGTAHPIGSTSAGLTLSNYDQSRADCWIQQPPSSATVTLNDGSGYTVELNLDVLGSGMANVYARSGIWGEVWVQGSVNEGGITDPNYYGQGYTTSSNTTTYSDTLGTALTVTAGSTSTTYTYTGPNNSQATYTMKYTSKSVRTNFGCSRISEYSSPSQYLVTEIDLPDIATNASDKYTFTYEATPGYSGYVTGRLASVTLPTGGTISYSYSGGSNGITCADGSTTTLTRTTPDGTWTYAHTENSTTTWSTTVTDPAGNQTAFNFVVDASGNDHETERQIYQGSTSGTLKETVDTCYNGSSIPCVTTAVSLPISNRTIQVTLPGLSAAKTTTAYNSYSLPTETDEYAYGSSLVRKTLTSYASPGNYVNDRPSDVQIKDGAGNVAAHSAYSYDSRGNLTQETRYTGGTPSTISRSWTYGSSAPSWGIVQTATDFNGNTTSYSNFTCSSNTAFPQTATLPLSLSTSTSWDCNVALPSSATGVNGRSTSFSYDSMVRPTGTSYPDGGAVGTTYTNSTQTDVETAVTSSITRHDQLDFDGLGRVVTTALVNDPDGETTVATGYDASGRLASLSNPYRGANSPGGDTYTYDALNRRTRVTHVDSTYAPISYGGSTSQSCSPSTYGYGYATLYTDESGKQRQTFTDALGRLIEVDEPDSGGNLTVNTCYTYDVLNNLYQVIQGSQTRTFVHDMLSRVTQATTPETGTIYLYYATSGGSFCSGNPKSVCRRTDGRGITTTYTYDALNRPIGKSYSNNNPTATSYTYDETSCLGLSVSCYNRGRRTTMTDASGSTHWAYDAMGRILMEQRTINSVTKNIAYTYNLDGSTATVTYPSGHTITYSVSAAQRPQSAVDTSNYVNYVIDATYAPQGGVTGALLGYQGGLFGGINFVATFTSRLLPYSVSAASSGGNALNLTFGYYANGNVQTITNNLNTDRTETITYDIDPALKECYAAA